MAKAQLAAECEHLAAQIFHHIGEHIRADVGFGIVSDGLRRAERVKLLEHPGDAHIVRAGVELAVGKSARAALAELDVGALVKRSAGPEAADIRRARVHIAAALEHDGAKPRLCQHERGEHPRRAEADHHGAAFRAAARDGIDGRKVSIRVFIFGTQQDFVLVFHRDGDGIDPMDVRLAPRVEGFAQDFDFLNRLGLDAELARGKGIKLRFVLSGRQPEVTQADHSSLPARRPLAQAHWRL